MSDSAGRSRKRPSFLDPAKNTPHFSWKISRANAKYGELVFCERGTLEVIGGKVVTTTYAGRRPAIDGASREIARRLGALRHTTGAACRAGGSLPIRSISARID